MEINITLTIPLNHNHDIEVHYRFILMYFIHIIISDISASLGCRVSQFGSLYFPKMINLVKNIMGRS
jgi:hypothetical protein